MTTSWSKSEPILSWSHYRRLSIVDDVNAREWYKREAAEQTWSYAVLDRNISTQYYQRMLVSQAQNTDFAVKVEKASKVSSGDG